MNQSNRNFLIMKYDSLVNKKYDDYLFIRSTTLLINIGVMESRMKKKENFQQIIYTKSIYPI